MDFVKSVQEAMDADSELNTVVKYFKVVFGVTSDAELDRLRNRYYKWKYHDMYEACLRDLLGVKKNAKGKLKIKASVNQLHSPYHAIESKLDKEFTEQIKKGRKESSNWICIKAKQFFIQEKEANPAR